MTRKRQREERRSPQLRIGLVLVGAVALTALVASTAGDPFRPSEDLLTPPSGRHLLGTDELGRDVLVRLVHGAGTALRVAVPAAVAAAIIGSALGLVSGFFGGLVDDVVVKITEIFQVLPGLLLALVASAVFGARLPVVVAVLAVIFWPHTARLVRADAIALRETAFVEAARAAGATSLRIMSRHLLPAVIPLVLVTASHQAGAAILIEAGLGFLGLGDRNVVSWGAMVADAQSFLRLAWWMSVSPGLAIAVAVLGLNLLGEGIADVYGQSASGPRPLGLRTEPVTDVR